MTNRADIPRLRQGSATPRAKRGFTLVETLMALMILVILTGIVAMGIPVAFETYTKAVNGSNAQVVLSTATNVLRDELGMAQDVQTAPDGTVLTYVTGDGHYASLAVSGAGTGSRIQRHDYIGIPGSLSEAAGSPRAVITDAAMTDALGITFDGITYADGVFTVNGLAVIDGEGNTLAAVGDAANGQYKIRAIMLGDSSEEG